MTIDKRLTRLGLTFHPFATAVAAEVCHITPEMTHVLTRCDHLASQGGFAVITGDVGTGKSTLLRCLQSRLRDRTDLVCGVLTRPQASLSDFYREMGTIFAVSLSPSNRWGGTRVLRERWQAHWNTAHLRPVLIIDEAQEMRVEVLSEVRLLTAAELDAGSLLSVVLAGDGRLLELLQERALLPLASRIRVSHRTSTASQGELMQLLDHLLTRAGNPALMTDGLKHSLAEHAMGNRRSLMYLGDQMVEAALADPDCQKLDEPLFIRTVRPATGTAGANRPRKAS
jgi:type II secretory pathway predicted ATPase ExeA